MVRNTLSSRAATLREVVGLVDSEATPAIKARLVGALLLITAASALSAAGPLALKHLVDGFVSRAEGLPRGVDVWVALYVLTQWASRSLSEIRGLVYSKAERRMYRTLTERLFGHVLRLPLRFHLERQTGAIVQTLTNGLQGYQTVLHTLVFSMLPVTTELATIVVVLSRLNVPRFLEFYCAALMCYVGVFAYAAIRTRATARDASIAQVDATAAITDCILNYEAIKYFTAESNLESQVSGVLARTEERWLRFYRQYTSTGVLVATIYAAFLGATILYATHEVYAGRISVGTFVLINSYMLQIVRPVEMLGYAVQSLSQGVASLEKMVALLREKIEAPALLAGEASKVSSHTNRSSNASRIPRRGSGIGGPGEPHGSADKLTANAISPQRERAPHHAHGDRRASLRAATRSSIRENRHSTQALFRPVQEARASPLGGLRSLGELEFRDVHLAYHRGRPILQGLNFRVSPGKTLGIVGESGSGKSTIVRLLARLLEPDQGIILLDGIPLSSWPLTQLRQALAVVPQDTVLFNASIGYNIALARPGSTQQDLEYAASLAHLHELIMSLPEGYGTPVGERGVKLSGGERQRVSIARAALKRPLVFVADEATSSLDSRAEAEIIGNLEDVARRTTALMIAHRLSTLVRADEIIVLANGAVAEHGTHDVLLQKNGRYASLWRAQHGQRISKS